MELEDREGKKIYAFYKSFSIGSESEGFPLTTVKGYSGDAGDALKSQLGSKFTTRDFDRDGSSNNCADIRGI